MSIISKIKKSVKAKYESEKKRVAEVKESKKDTRYIIKPTITPTTKVQGGRKTNDQGTSSVFNPLNPKPPFGGNKKGKGGSGNKPTSNNGTNVLLGTQESSLNNVTPSATVTTAMQNAQNRANQQSQNQTNTVYRDDEYVSAYVPNKNERIKKYISSSEDYTKRVDEFNKEATIFSNLYGGKTFLVRNEKDQQDYDKILSQQQSLLQREKELGIEGKNLNLEFNLLTKSRDTSKFGLSVSEQERTEQKIFNIIDESKVGQLDFGNILTGGKSSKVTKELLKGGVGGVSGTIGFAERSSINLKRQVTERPIESAVAVLNIALPVVSSVKSFLRTPKEVAVFSTQADDVTKSIVQTKSIFGKSNYYKQIGKDLVKVSSQEGEQFVLSATGTQKVGGKLLEQGYSASVSRNPLTIKNAVGEDLGVASQISGASVTKTSLSSFDAVAFDTGSNVLYKGVVYPVKKGLQSQQFINVMGVVARPTPKGEGGNIVKLFTTQQVQKGFDIVGGMQTIQTMPRTILLPNILQPQGKIIKTGNIGNKNILVGNINSLFDSSIKTGITTKPNVRESIISRNAIDTSFKFDEITSTTNAVKSATKLSTLEKPTTAMKPNINFPITPLQVTTPASGGILGFDAGFGGGSFGRTSKKGKQKKKYQSSLFSQIFKIKGKTGTLTGLELRGL